MDMGNTVSLSVDRSDDEVIAKIKKHLLVECVQQLSSDVVMIRFVRQDGQALPEWAPGDHIDIEFQAGLTRQYSLCGPRPDTNGWSVAVRLDPESTGGSSYAHSRVREGDTFRVVGPKRRFPLEHADHHVFIAGGIGITPIMSMAEQLASEGRAFELSYFDRSEKRTIFAERLKALGGRTRVVDRATEPDVTLSQVTQNLPSNALVYACGPKRMISELREIIGPDRLRTEDFRPEPTPGNGGQSGRAVVDQEFEVQLGVGGEIHPVSAGCSLLDVLLKAGVDVMWSCREGNCASCETTVLVGAPDHRDVILTGEERTAGDVMFPCVSRSLSPRLVLDV